MRVGIRIVFMYTLNSGTSWCFWNQLCTVQRDLGTWDQLLFWWWKATTSFCLFACLCGTVDKTLSLIHASQVLYHWALDPTQVTTLLNSNFKNTSLNCLFLMNKITNYIDLSGSSAKFKGQKINFINFGGLVYACAKYLHSDRLLYIGIDKFFHFRGIRLKMYFPFPVLTLLVMFSAICPHCDFENRSDILEQTFW